MPDWLEDASANRHIKTYVKDFLDVSGNLSVRKNNEDYKWNSYGQILSGVYESDNNVHFGVTLDMDASGTTIIVGAHRDNIQGSEDGAAYVYRYDTTAEIWYQLGNTLFENGTTDFGVMTSISNDGSRVAVGDDGVNHIYFYDYNSSTNTWDSAGSITNSIYLDELSGIRLSGDGNTIIFGAYSYSSNKGIVNVKRNTSGTTWTTIGTFTGGSSNHLSANGLSISYNGNRISIGEKDYNTDSDGNESIDSGRAAIYDYSGSGTTWNQVGDWIHGNLAGGRFPRSAKMSSDGSKIVFGAEYNNRVMVYEYDATVTGSWKQLGSHIHGSYGTTANSGQFGRSVNMSADGTIIAVGEHSNDYLGTDRGAIYIYKYINGFWEQQGETLYGPINTGESMGYYHGVGLSADGTKVIGSMLQADLNTTESGGVVAWQWSKKAPYSNPPLDISGGALTISTGEENNLANWKVDQVGLTLTPSVSEANDDVAINADGSVIVTGANNGMYVYKYNLDRWQQVGGLIKHTSYGGQGECVVINDAGNIVSTGTSSWKMHVWELDKTGDWSLKGSTITGTVGTNFGFRGNAMNGQGNRVVGKSNSYVAAYEYDTNTSDWVQMGSDITAVNYLNNTYRNELAMNKAGDIIAIGRPLYDLPRNDTGRVDIYKFTGDISDGSWNLLGYIDHRSSGNDDDYLGVSVSLSDDGYTLAVSTPYFNSDEGRGFVYKYSEIGNRWEQFGPEIKDTDVLFDTTTSAGLFASGISISGDGKTLVISDQNAYTSNKIPGCIHIMKYMNGKWTWIGKLGGDAHADYWGPTCGISRDGTHVVGGPGLRGVDFKVGKITNYPPMHIKDGLVTLGGKILTEDHVSVRIGDDSTSILSTENNYAVLNITKVTPVYNNVTTVEKNIVTSVGVVDDNFGIDQVYKIERQKLYGRSEAITAAYQNHHFDSLPGTSEKAQWYMYVYSDAQNTYREYSFRNNGYFYALAWATSSDDRLKKNETMITNATETIMKLSPQKYEKYTNLDCSGSFVNDIGLMTQDLWYNAAELQHLVHLGQDASKNTIQPLPLPEGVNTTHDIQNDPDYTSLGWGITSSSLNYDGLIPYLIKSNQEQQEIIDAEKEKNVELETKNVDLKSRATTLTSQIADIITRVIALENQ